METTSMEYDSTMYLVQNYLEQNRVLENISRWIENSSPLNQTHAYWRLKIWPNSRLSHRRQMVRPRSHTPQRELAAQPGAPLLIKLQCMNKILKQWISLAKKMYYVSRFESIKDDTRKMWENISMVFNNMKTSVPLPLHFFVDNKIESGGL